MTNLADPAQQFLDALAQMGGSAGNVRLREKLGWDEATYDQIQSILKFEGKILSEANEIPSNGCVLTPGWYIRAEKGIMTTNRLRTRCRAWWWR